MKTAIAAITGLWHVRTANGRLPLVRERKRPHGEASTYEASIGAGDTLLGPLVCKLDFGYGYASKADMEAVTRLIASAPALVDVLTDALLASGYGVTAPIPEADRYSVHAWVFKARTLLATIAANVENK